MLKCSRSMPNKHSLSEHLSVTPTLQVSRNCGRYGY
jgi:hypothetical protein